MTEANNKVDLNGIEDMVTPKNTHSSFVTFSSNNPNTTMGVGLGSNGYGNPHANLDNDSSIDYTHILLSILVIALVPVLWFTLGKIHRYIVYKCTQWYRHKSLQKPHGGHCSYTNKSVFEKRARLYTIYNSLDKKDYIDLGFESYEDFLCYTDNTYDGGGGGDNDISTDIDIIDYCSLYHQQPQQQQQHCCHKMVDTVVNDRNRNAHSGCDNNNEYLIETIKSEDDIGYIKTSHMRDITGFMGGNYPIFIYAIISILLSMSMFAILFFVLGTDIRSIAAYILVAWTALWLNSVIASFFSNYLSYIAIITTDKFRIGTLLKLNGQMANVGCVTDITPFFIEVVICKLSDNKQSLEIIYEHIPTMSFYSYPLSIIYKFKILSKFQSIKNRQTEDSAVINLSRKKKNNSNILQQQPPPPTNSRFHIEHRFTSGEQQQQQHNGASIFH